MSTVWKVLPDSAFGVSGIRVIWTKQNSCDEGLRGLPLAQLGTLLKPMQATGFMACGRA
jgi:hypothetical protein